MTDDEAIAALGGTVDENPEAPERRLMPLSAALDALRATQGRIRPVSSTLLDMPPDLDRAVLATLDEHAWRLAYWWYRSPSGLVECDACGEVASVGDGSRERACYWARCDGRMKQLRPADVFEGNRPRRRRVTIESLVHG